MIPVYLGLGSNINREQHIGAAIQALAGWLVDVRVSAIYESEAFGFSGDPFYNLVVAGSTEDSLEQVMTRLKQIEDDNGRDRSGPKFGPRSLDIDLLSYGSLQGKQAGICLPRPEIFEQAYVLRPLAELAPELVLPGQQANCCELWQSFDAASQPLRLIALS